MPPTLSDPVLLALIGAVVSISTAVLAYLAVKVQRLNTATKALDITAKEIHTAVNSTQSALTNENQMLKKTLLAHKIPVPIVPDRTNGSEKHP